MVMNEEEFRELEEFVEFVYEVLSYPYARRLELIVGESGLEVFFVRSLETGKIKILEIDLHIPLFPTRGRHVHILCCLSRRDEIPPVFVIAIINALLSFYRQKGFNAIELKERHFSPYGMTLYFRKCIGFRKQ